jgi:3-dehydroquinate synthase
MERLGFSLWHEACDLGDASGARLLRKGLEEFREHLGGELTITLLGKLGTGVEVHAMDERLIDDALDWLRAGAPG